MKTLDTVWTARKTDILEKDTSNVVAEIYYERTENKRQWALYCKNRRSSTSFHSWHVSLEVAGYAALVWYNNQYLLRKDNN